MNYYEPGNVLPVHQPLPPDVSLMSVHGPRRDAPWLTTPIRPALSGLGSFTSLALLGGGAALLWYLFSEREVMPSRNPTPVRLPRRVGESVRFESFTGVTEFEVKKKGAGSYVLKRIRPSSTRTRWGNAAEVREDVDYAMTYGTLPPAARGSWA